MKLAIMSLIMLLLGSLLVAGTPADNPPFDWKLLDPMIGSASTLKDDVCTFTIPRKDLDVTIDQMEVPTAAGIASEFRFFKCSCGKIRVVGQFCCVDYETNDVIDAIRPGAMITVSSVSPMFSNDRPRIMLIRFQGEGDASALAALLKSGLSWMGEARSATRPVTQK